MKKEQFKNLVKSVQMLLEGRRNDEEEYANFPTAAEMGRDPMGYDDPAAVQSGLFKGSTPVAPHSNVSTSMGAHPSMVPRIQPKQFGRQLSLSTMMPHPGEARNPHPFLYHPIIKDNLHELSPEDHEKAKELAKNVSWNEPSTMISLAHFFVSRDMDTKHPFIRQLWKTASEAQDWNDDRYRERGE
jgi:hypothetical protein